MNPALSCHSLPCPVGSQWPFINLFLLLMEAHRGFTFEAYQPADASSQKRALRATRGRITLFVEVSEGELPEGWHLRDILQYEINRLMDPRTLRHVDHLN